ncbi:MAG: hypothetical protein Q9160_001812 [Pyrenula sp. 1 TL-2023]
MSTPLPPPSPHPVALITASSAGLGSACALALAPTHSIIINYFSREEKALEVLSRCNALNSSPSSPPSSSTTPSTFKNRIIRADASSRADLTDLITSITTTHGRLDIVVSNAGWTRVTNFADLDADGALDDELWDRCWRANVKSHLWLFHAARPWLLMTEWGQRFSQDKVDAVVQRSALKRVATVEEVAEQVKLLCMNRGITGQNVLVDGGLII